MSYLNQRPASPSYSKKTQDVLQHKMLRDEIQQYYLNQQKLKQKMQTVQKRHKSRGSTFMAAANAGIVAVGPIPLEVGRKRVATPSYNTPVAPLPSPVAQRKGMESQGNELFPIVESFPIVRSI